MNLDFSVVVNYIPQILTGASWTVIITTCATAISIAFGIIFALIVLYSPKYVQIPMRGFIWLFMGTPLLLQLFLLYYGLAQIGITFSSIWVGIVGLGLHFAVYNADVIRISIVTIDKGQTEGARSIGFSGAQTLRYVVLPQAMRNALPQIGNNLIAMLKDSAIISILGITELVHASQQAIGETYRPFEFYITVAAVYYVLNFALEYTLGRTERRLEKY